MNAAERWGLPADFQPVRFDIMDDVKEAMRPLLQANEPVIVSLTNRTGSVTILATPYRLFAIKTGELSSSGVSGCNIKEYPWAGITRLVGQQAADNLRLAIHYQSINGKTVEVGRRAAMGRPAVDNLTPFDRDKGHEALAALNAIWESRSRADA